MERNKAGKADMKVQFSSGYESSNGFREAFSRLVGAESVTQGRHNLLKASWLDTPLGPMAAIADENALYFLKFADRPHLKRDIERLQRKTKSTVVLGTTQPTQLIESELNAYFEGALDDFKTPLFLTGSPFQRRVWEELQKIPRGETRSYSDLAMTVGKPSAFRAVAQANAANRFAIIIPCHRVISANGGLGGYGGGLGRKEWLINHERRRSR